MHIRDFANKHMRNRGVDKAFLSSRNYPFSLNRLRAVVYLKGLSFLRLLLRFTPLTKTITVSWEAEQHTFKVKYANCRL
jgi:hypothetical protein